MTRARPWILLIGVIVVAVAIAFYAFVVRAPIYKTPTGPIPSLSAASPTTVAVVGLMRPIGNGGEIKSTSGGSG